MGTSQGQKPEDRHPIIATLQGQKQFLAKSGRQNS